MDVTQYVPIIVEKFGIIFSKEIDDKGIDKVNKMITTSLNSSDKYFITLYDMLLDDDINMNNIGFNSLLNLCLIHNINMWKVISTLAIAIVARLKAVDTICKEDENYPKCNEIIYEDGYADVMIYLIGEHINHLNNDENLKKEVFVSIPDEIKLKMLDVSFEETIANVKKMNININLDKHREEVSVEGDLEQHHSVVKDIFSNKKITSKFALKNNPHALHKLSNSKITYNKKEKMYEFIDFTNALVTGYTQKAFLIGIDKDKAVRELESKLRTLEDYNLPETEKLIEYTKKLIEFIKSKKHSDKVPFKEIGKALGMKKNEARNYAKMVLHSINSKVFEEFYEKDLSIK